MKALIEVFFQPGKVFSGLAERRAAWVAPLIANAILLRHLDGLITVNVMGIWI